MTSHSKLSGDRAGTLVMKFDHGGKRQALSGDTSLAASVSVCENARVSVHLKSLHTASTAPAEKVTPFKPDERRILQQDFRGPSAQLKSYSRANPPRQDLTDCDRDVIAQAAADRPRSLHERGDRFSGGAADCHGGDSLMRHALPHPVGRDDENGRRDPRLVCDWKCPAFTKERVGVLSACELRCTTVRKEPGLAVARTGAENASVGTGFDDERGGEAHPRHGAVKLREPCRPRGGCASLTDLVDSRITYVRRCVGAVYAPASTIGDDKDHTIRQVEGFDASVARTSSRLLDSCCVYEGVPHKASFRRSCLPHSRASSRVAVRLRSGGGHCDPRRVAIASIAILMKPSPRSGAAEGVASGEANIFMVQGGQLRSGTTASSPLPRYVSPQQPSCPALRASREQPSCRCRERRSPVSCARVRVRRYDYAPARAPSVTKSYDIAHSELASPVGAAAQ